MDFLRAAAQGNDIIELGVQACPFLRSIIKDTNLDLAKRDGGFTAGNDKSNSQCPAQRGPIFCDEPNFESTFRLFHGTGGVVPLKRFSTPLEKSVDSEESQGSTCSRSKTADSVLSAPHPLAASAATISMSAFGGGGPNPFSWDGFMAGRNKHKQPEPIKSTRPDPVKSSRHTQASGKNLTSQQDALKSRSEFARGTKPQQGRSGPKPTNATAIAEASTQHHKLGDPVDAKEWLNTSDCPIAKMHRVFMELAPAATEFVRSSTHGVKFTCPAPIIAARAALARTAPVRQLRPQPLSTKLLAVGGSTLLVNVPFGAWREHVEKFSPEWFVAVHVTVPFVAMLRKAVLMPKHAMVVTVLAAVLGQLLGSRGERYRVQKQQTAVQHQAKGNETRGVQPLAAALLSGGMERQAVRVERNRGVDPRLEQSEMGGSLSKPEAAALEGGAPLGVFDLFSGKAEEMGWTANRMKDRANNRKPCRLSWKLPSASGLGLEGKAVRVH